MTEWRGRFLVAVLAVLMLWPGGGWAQSADDYTRLGNEAYNTKKFAEAVAAYVKAIQADPAGALRAYVNCARAHNKMGHFPEALAYYQWYLELAPQADDVRKVREELNGVRRRVSGEPGSILTVAQKTALQQVEEALRAGPFLTSDGGGAVAAYDVLLRTGFATPQLIGLRQALGRGLEEEIRQVMTPAPGMPTAALDRAGWALVRERMERMMALQNESLTSAWRDAVLATASAWEHYFRGNYAAAAVDFAQAVATEPALLSAHWGRALTVLALSVDGLSTEETLQVLAETHARHRARGSDDSDAALTLLRVMGLQRTGQTEAAARHIIEARW